MQTQPNTLFDRLTGAKPKKTYPLGTLRLRQDVDEENVLQLLNAVPTPIRPNTGLFSHMLFRGPDPGTLLREFVDEWIDSGWGPDKVERPRARLVPKDGKVGLAVFTYSQSKVHLIAGWDGKLALWLDPPESLSDPKWARMAALGLAPAESDTLAQCLITFILLSPLGVKLAKCRAAGCSHYFVLKQTSRSYEGGTLCDRHKRVRSQSSARAVTAVDRQLAKNTLHRLAAKRFSRKISPGSQWFTEPKLKTAIADFLNLQIERNDLLTSIYLKGGRQGISGKWVANSKNWTAIEAILKDVNDAKG